MSNQNLINEIVSLPPDELLQLKSRIITDRDKRKYAKEVLSNLDRQDAELTIKWLKDKYALT